MTKNLKTVLLAGALVAALIPAVVAAQNAAQPKAAAPAAKATAKAAAPAAASGPRVGPFQPVYYGSFKPAKNVFGQPDVSGAWSNSSLTPLGRQASYGDRLVMTPDEVKAREGLRQEDIDKSNARTDPKLSTQEVNKTCDVRGFSGVGCGYNGGFVDPGDTIMRVHGEPRASFITYPANGQVPPARATSQAIASLGAEEGDESLAAGRGGGRGGAAAAAGGGRGGGRGAGGGGGGGGGGARDGTQPENHPLAERCVMSFGSGRGTLLLPQLYNNNVRITQGKDSVAIWIEMIHDVRVVRIGGKHRADGVRPWFGDSVGHYEGNSLVVETANYHPQNQINGRSAADLVLTEKFTKVSPQRLLYQFNIHSPANWDADWGGEYEFQASDGIYEYACHEGNYALEGILAGELAVVKPGAPTPLPFSQLAGYR